MLSTKVPEFPDGFPALPETAGDAIRSFRKYRRTALHLDL